MYVVDRVMTSRRDKDDPRFDRWLSRRLHEAYDGVLKEQLPADLEQLVRQLGSRDVAGGSAHDDSDGTDDDGLNQGRRSGASQSPYRN